MQCELIFYVAHKTGYNETIFSKKLESSDLQVSKTQVATTPIDLGELLKASLERSNLVFIIGGLQRTDETNIVEILSKCLENRSKEKIICKRIENSQGKNDGYIVQSGRQMIVMLPDVPDELEIMAGNVLLQYISEFYSLKFKKMDEDAEKKVSFKSYESFDTFLENVQKNTIYDYDMTSYRVRRFDKFKHYLFTVIRALLMGLGVVVSAFVIVYLLFILVIYG